MRLFPALPFLLALMSASAAPANIAEEYKQGHSHLGDEFDAGPREKPWIIPGIGEAKFPISSKNAEAQKWFDQGNALLHSFWYYEAERSFRWARKLDPDHPMPYWGL